MSLEHLTTFDSINQFLEGTQAVAFSVAPCVRVMGVPLESYQEANNAMNNT